MTTRNPLLQQVATLPTMIDEILGTLYDQIKDTFSPTLCRHLERIFIVGCGDSYHAGVCTELAFEHIAGLPCEPMTAMQFSRYAVSYLPLTAQGENLLLGISVSGGVSRTIEAINLGKQAGVFSVAITGNKDTPIAKIAESILLTTIPPLPDELTGLVVPGSRSYITSLCALYLLAIHIGVQRDHLSTKQVAEYLRVLKNTAEMMAISIRENDQLAAQLVHEWQDANQFTYCGSGPNFGTAMFSSAKLLEASGDIAIAQDIEEWAHLQYFAKEKAVPTLFISAGKRDSSRTAEVITAANAIGRRTAIICPAESALTYHPGSDFQFKIWGNHPECFSPLLNCIPGIQIAAYRAQLIDEPYFRNFAGGRSPEGGGGISRIRTSEQLMDLSQLKD